MEVGGVREDGQKEGGREGGSLQGTFWNCMTLTNSCLELETKGIFEEMELLATSAEATATPFP